MAGWTDGARRADMSDDDNYLRSSRSFRVTADATTLMLKGAGYAAIACLGIVFVALVLLGIAAILPEDSKNAADPTPELSMALPATGAPVA